MIKELFQDGAPSGATHIDKEGDYWKVVSDDEAYFMEPSYANKLVRYIFKTSRAFRKHNLQPL